MVEKTFQGKKVIRTNLWGKFVENFEVFLALLVAIVIFVLNILGNIPDRWLSSTFLLLVAALAYSNLKDRDRISKLKGELINSIEQMKVDLKKAGTGGLSADRFFHLRSDAPMPGLIDRTNKTLDMIGTTLFSVAVTHQGAIRRLKDEGVKIRLIVSNPDNEILHKIYHRRFLEISSPERHAESVRSSLEFFRTMIGENSEGGSLEVRTTDNDVSFSYVGIDTKFPEGKISIELYLTKVALGRNPLFSLQATTDPKWYKEFSDQFEIFWNSGVKVN